MFDQCRVCLVGDKLMFQIFNDASISRKIQICCGVKIPNTPALPSQICKKCLDILNVAYDFRVLCQRSQEYLNDHIKDLTEEDEDEKPNAEFEADVKDEEIIGELKYTIEEDCPDDTYGGDDSESDEEKPKDIGDETGAAEVKVEQKSQDKVFRGRYRKKHKSPPPASYMCNFCGNMYKNKYTFTYHLKTHVDTKQHQCEICPKRFKQAGELKSHIRTHTGEKPYKCSYCDRKFTDTSGKIRHERTHTNERPFGCTICGSNFSYAATLKRHKLIHTGEKPYQCHVCDKSFAEKHKLKEHFRTIRHRQNESNALNST